MTGWRGLEYKERRRARRRNHIVKDLHKDKYHQRVIPSKNKMKAKYNQYYDEDEDYS